jgi:hypothetical protein
LMWVILKMPMLWFFYLLVNIQLATVLMLHFGIGKSGIIPGF